MNKNKIHIYQQREKINKIKSLAQCCNNLLGDCIWWTVLVTNLKIFVAIKLLSKLFASLGEILSKTNEPTTTIMQQQKQQQMINKCNNNVFVNNFELRLCLHEGRQPPVRHEKTQNLCRFNVK